MMTTDGVNGAWVAVMVQRADRRARVASRVMGLAIGLLGIAIAALGMIRLFSQEAAGGARGSRAHDRARIGVRRGPRPTSSRSGWRARSAS